MSQQLALDLVQPLAPSLDNFVVGRNAEALAALRSLGSASGATFVYLWGIAGSGRTHLLRATGLDAERNARVPEFDASRRIHAVDDVDSLDAADQHRLFILANEVRATSGAALVAAGAAPPAALQLREDVRTRLAWGLVYQLQPLSDDDKREAMLRHAQSRGVELPLEVVQYLLNHVPRDMRALVAILDALDARALATRRAITVPFVREWMSEPAT